MPPDPPIGRLGRPHGQPPPHSKASSYAPVENGMAVIAVRHSFYLGSEGEGGAGSKIQLSQYQYTAGDIRTREYTIDVGGGFDRLFYGNFARNGYVYYFVADQRMGFVYFVCVTVSLARAPVHHLRHCMS